VRRRAFGVRRDGMVVGRVTSVTLKRGGDAGWQQRAAKLLGC
jgi:hypothetical protein